MWGLHLWHLLQQGLMWGLQPLLPLAPPKAGIDVGAAPLAPPTAGIDVGAATTSTSGTSYSRD